MNNKNLPPVKPPAQSEQRTKKVLIGVFIMLAFMSGWYFGHFDQEIKSKGFTPQILNKDSNSNVDFSIFWKTWDLVNSKYDGPIDPQKLLYGAIKGMVDSLDNPYTVFMDPDEAKQFEQELSGSISGIGAEVGIKNNLLSVITPIKGSPAEKAGLRTGDVITKIDEEDTLNMSLNEAVMKIRGAEGTKVKLAIVRSGKEEIFEIVRAKITIESVKWEVKNGDIGYIEISRFDEDTAQKLREAKSELISKGVKGIVLDLRNNPGGFLDSSIDVSSEFLKSGVVVIEKRTDGSDEHKFSASGKGRYTDTKVPVAVLVNEGSASASEIVAGALQDHGRGALIGVKTFGKGSVQEIEDTGQGTTLRITVAHWFTPKGRSIDKEGLNPDIEVKMSDEDFNANRDPQLDKALEYIKGKI
ncbi:hypothetical protein COY62_02055 [bacterium (Candidatus Howlettbacteria) CG_4_10_14_0_8_um_filter_40_9]|nr:MAG: hypothetical protein COY62_02055 [bacterium (Candidatus Howlettbacteria) CG_4_10_14_0_8_um_filter_40_9]